SSRHRRRAACGGAGRGRRGTQPGTGPQPAREGRPGRGQLPAEQETAGTRSPLADTAADVTGTPTLASRARGGARERGNGGTRYPTGVNKAMAEATTGITGAKLVTLDD